MAIPLISTAPTAAPNTTAPSVVRHAAGDPSGTPESFDTVLQDVTGEQGLREENMDHPEGEHAADDLSPLAMAALCACSVAATVATEATTVADGTAAADAAVESVVAGLAAAHTEAVQAVTTAGLPEGLQSAAAVDSPTAPSLVAEMTDTQDAPASRQTDEQHHHRDEAMAALAANEASPATPDAPTPEPLSPPATSPAQPSAENFATELSWSNQEPQLSATMKEVASPARPSAPEPEPASKPTEAAGLAGATTTPTIAQQSGLTSDQHEQEHAHEDRPAGSPPMTATVAPTHERFALPPGTMPAASPPAEPKAAAPVPPVVSEPLPVTPVKAMHVSIDPPEIGAVDLRVVVSDQRVYASVSTARADVGQYLMTNQTQLQQGLQAYGLDLSAFRVDVDARGAGQQPGWSFGSNGNPSAAPQPHTLGPLSEPTVQSSWREAGALSVFA